MRRRAHTRTAAAFSAVLAAMATPNPSRAQDAAIASAAPRLDWLADKIAADASAKGVSRRTLERAFTGLERDPEVVQRVNTQAEHERTVGQYIDLIASPTRIAAGRDRLAEHAATLARIEQTYGVDRHVVVAIWGIESNFGGAQGGFDVIRSLATLMLEDQRRPDLWRTELVAALAILEQGHVGDSRITGSWAGAMGHTQFMPSSFHRLAVDFDGDGRRDIWGAPVDALASTANFLKRSGWTTGRQWGFEVILPRDFDVALSVPSNDRPAAFWRDHGVTLAAGSPLPDGEASYRLLLPAGANGPAFLVSSNFAALLRYNNAIPYALAVGHLSDRLAGGATLSTPWPDERALTRAERHELQSRLVERGLLTGSVDGLIGSLTRAAIRTYQKGSGLPEDGHPGPALLERLRGTMPQTAQQGPTEQKPE